MSSIPGHPQMYTQEQLTSHPILSVIKEKAFKRKGRPPIVLIILKIQIFSGEIQSCEIISHIEMTHPLVSRCSTGEGCMKSEKNPP